MSQENVEIVQRGYEAFNTGDWDTAFREYAHPDAELYAPPIYPEGRQVYVGRRGFAEWSATIRDAWAEWHFEPERYFDLGADVLVFTRLVAKSETSAIELDREVAHLWKIKDGRVAAVRVYLERDEALEAAGLSE